MYLQDFVLLLKNLLMGEITVSSVYNSLEVLK